MADLSDTSEFDPEELFSSDGSNPDDALSDTGRLSIPGPYTIDSFSPIAEEDLRSTE